jgi:hypothetical protein
MRIFKIFLPLMCLSLFPLFSQTRSFGQIFPRLPPAARAEAFSSGGYYKTFGRTTPSALAGSGQNSVDPQIVQTLFSKQPGFVVESIRVIPGAAGEYTMLDVYNALGRTRSLAGRVYHSHTRNEYVPLFEEVTRIESAKRNTAIADPQPSSVVPRTETIYIRLKDVNFGTSFYRGDMGLSRYGLSYSLSNFKSLTYLLIPVIREEKFVAQLYFEPIAEGILIYGLAGADVSDFVSSRIDMASAISKRLTVIISWVAEGIARKIR